MDDQTIKAVVENPATPGIVGSALAAFYFMPGDTVMAKFGNFIAGGAFTWFVAPFAIEYLNLKTQAAQSFVSFAVGMIGLAISIAVWGWFKTKLDDLKIQDIFPWVKKGQ